MHQVTALLVVDSETCHQTFPLHNRFSSIYHRGHRCLVLRQHICFTTSIFISILSFSYARLFKVDNRSFLVTGLSIQRASMSIFSLAKKIRDGCGETYLPSFSLQRVFLVFVGCVVVFRFPARCMLLDMTRARQY